MNFNPHQKIAAGRPTAETPALSEPRTLDSVSNATHPFTKHTATPRSPRKKSPDMQTSLCPQVYKEAKLAGRHPLSRSCAPSPHPRTYIKLPPDKYATPRTRPRRRPARRPGRSTRCRPSPRTRRAPKSRPWLRPRRRATGSSGGWCPPSYSCRGCRSQAPRLWKVRDRYQHPHQPFQDSASGKHDLPLRR